MESIKQKFTRENLKANRRGLLKMGAYLTTVALTINFVTKNHNPTPLERDSAYDSERRYENWYIPNTMWGMVIDLAKCDGCVDLSIPRCTAGCQEGHYLPTKGYNTDGTIKDEQTVHEYIKVFQIKDNSWSEPYFFPRPCQQCLDPPCVHVCPVGAAFQRSGDRLTLVDQERCIGCRLCMAACPYEVRFFHWEENSKSNLSGFTEALEAEMPFSINKQKGVIAKCDFCGNQFLGKLPHCVASCHKGALYFGNLLENSVTNNMGETLLVDETIAKRKGFRWKEEEGTRPRVFYLPASNGEN